MTTYLKKGYGYWDVTHYPYGGCFRRATEDTPLEILGLGGKYPGERKVRLPNGNLAVVDTWKATEEKEHDEETS